METFRKIAEMHYGTEPNNEADKQYRLNRIDALEKLLTEQCAISIIGNSTPSEMFEQLKQAVVQVTEMIDKETPWQNNEPEWWLEMIDLQAKCR